MALILVYVRKTNYFEKCESNENGDVMSNYCFICIFQWKNTPNQIKIKATLQLVHSFCTFPNFPPFHLPECSGWGLPVGERPSHIDVAKCAVHWIHGEHIVAFTQPNILVKFSELTFFKSTVQCAVPVQGRPQQSLRGLIVAQPDNCAHCWRKGGKDFSYFWNCICKVWDLMMGLDTSNRGNSRW